MGNNCECTHIDRGLGEVQLFIQRAAGCETDERAVGDGRIHDKVEAYKTTALRLDRSRQPFTEYRH